MAWYKAGTASVTNGSGAVVGVNTEFLQNCKSGDMFTVDKSRFYEILSVADDTHLTLAEGYAGGTDATSAYSIIPNFTNTLNAEIAMSVIALVAKYEAWVEGTFPGAFEIDASGDLRPVENIVSDVNWEYDGNGDLIPKEVAI